MLRKKVIKEIQASGILRTLDVSSCKGIHSLNETKHDKSNNSKADHDVGLNSNRGAFIREVLNGQKRTISETNLNASKVVIDFSSPNIAKPFHVGHLRSTIIGNFIANINMHFHNKVTKINYLGDWGTQFGLLQYGLNTQNIDINALKENPINVLYNVYVESNKMAANNENVRNEARKYFSDIEQGKVNLDNWKKIRQITIRELEKTYQRLGIVFDDYHWESDYNGEAIRGLMRLLEEKDILLTDETGKKYTTINNKTVTLLKSDNSTLYLSREVAALLDKYERYKFDKMLFVVDNAQSDHFVALFEIINKINRECVKKCEHIKFGRIRGMSTRRGNVVFLNDILDEAKQKMYYKQQQSKNTRTSAINEETCDILGITAVLINDLKQKRQKDYVFDWDKALQSEGDSGIKLQYLHCRLWNLEQNCGVKVPDICEPQYMKEDIINAVVDEISKFDNVLKKSYDANEACILVNYLFRLARYVNRMFNELKVKNIDTDLASQRMLVFNSARLVVKRGLEILGVKPLYEM